MSADEIVGAFLHDVGTGRLEVVRKALSASPALVNAVGPHPFWGGRPQALHVAIESDRRQLFDLLLDHGADLDGSNHEYLHWSPLLLTVHWKRTEWARALIDRGASIGLPEALALADDARLDELLDALGDHALRVPAPNQGTLLHFARTTHAIDRLIALDVAADRRDRWGVSAIEALSRLGPPGAPLVAHLAARGVVMGPAELARMGDRAGLERVLADDTASLHAPSTLQAAVDFGHRDLASWLIEVGCDVNGRAGGVSDVTPLHSAAWNGDLEMVRLLVDRGADIHARDRRHEGTPLRWAETAIEVTNNPKCAEVAEYLRPLTDAGDREPRGSR